MTIEELSNECSLCSQERGNAGDPPRQLILLGKTDKKGLDVLICSWCDQNKND